MQPENSPGFSSLEHLLAGNGFSYDFPATDSLCSSSFYTLDSFEFGEKHEARNVAASENHKEAERRRRERINGHLDRLRNLLVCNSKTDKASLLAMVVERVRELKQQTSEIMKCDQAFPSEADEIAVFQNEDCVVDDDGRSVVKASVCCEDRVDLMPELIEILKPLPLRPLRAEMVTLGGRMRNVMILAGDKDQAAESASLLREQLKSLILRSGYVGGERSKRRRIFDQKYMG